MRRSLVPVWLPTAAVAVALAGAIVTMPATMSGGPVVPGAELATTTRVETAMRAAGFDCTRLDVPTILPGFSSEQSACLVPWSAAVVRGSRAVVVIDIWTDPGTRTEWLASPTDVGTAAVVGPSWLLRCEFRSICTLFQAKAGGLMTLPQPGDDFEILDYRYYEKPFPPSVEHGITGHEPEDPTE